MMPNMMGMNQNIPSIKELWKDEKSKYRHWVIILAIGLIVITGLTITSFIINLVDRDNLIDQTTKDLSVIYKPNVAENMAEKAYVRTAIVFPSIISLSLIAGLIWYFVSLVDVYKHKNFAKLSGWPTLIIGVGSAISLVSLMMFVFNTNARAGMFATSGSIFAFVTKILYILIYFAASAPVSRLRKTFIVSDRVEKFKSDPNFQTMQKQMQDALKGGQMPYGAFGPVMASEKSPQQNPVASNNQTTPPPNKEEIELKRLKSLSIDNLKKVAKKLSISGHSNMKKDELIEAILRISKG